MTAMDAANKATMPAGLPSLFTKHRSPVHKDKTHLDQQVLSFQASSINVPVSDMELLVNLADNI